MESKKLALFNKLSFIFLVGTFFLSIFFFIPYISVSLEASKGFLISIGVTLSMFFWLIARMIDGKFTIPKEPILLFAFLIPVIFLISSFTSFSSYLSMFGNGFEVGTFGSMLVLFLVLFLSSVYFQKESRFKYFFKALFWGASVLALVGLFSLFSNLNTLLPGVFSSISSGNLFGNWNDFALFFGGIIVLSLITFELRPMKLLPHIWLTLLVFAGLFFLMLVNSRFVWVLTGIFSLIVFVYTISFNHFQNENLPIVDTNDDNDISKEKSFPVLSLIVILVCLIFIIGGSSVGNIIPNYFNVSNVNVYPSVSGTFSIAKQALWNSPILGTGPNTFSIDWSMWKPVQVLQSLFWNTDFKFGFGTIPTLMITTGILGILAWLLFLSVFLIRGFQSMRVALKNAFSNYIIVSSLMLALYFWIALFLSVAGYVPMMLAFASTGLFIGVLVYKKVMPIYDRSFLRDPRASFFSIFTLVVLMIASISATYIYCQKFISLVYFSRATLVENTLNSYANAENKVTKAISLDKNDLYYRGLSQIYIAQIQSLASNTSISQDILKSSMQNLVTQAENAANNAIQQNNTYYLNWTNLGDVYTAFVGMGIAGSYENAVEVYTKALIYSPKNPKIILSLAQLEIAHKDNARARYFANEALAVKPNYADALFVLAQIDISEGNMSSAIELAQKAASVAPNDATVFFRLGLLRYNANNYTDAIGAFETAIILNPAYWNARYFLGLSYQKMERKDDAKIQFNILKQYLPENQDVQNALDNMDNSIKIETDTTLDTQKPPLPNKN